MSVKALSDYTFYAKYANYLPEKQRREAWGEAVTRVFDMHRTKYADILEKSPHLRNELEFAERQVKKKRVLGAQRALQYGGEHILKRNERIYNCSSLLIDKPRSFQQVVWLLLAGCGVGFSVQKHHIAKLPDITKNRKAQSVKTFKIPDSCEGWADAVGVLLSSYLVDGGEFPEFYGKTVQFNFDEIRPKGSLIAGQFKAPGPEPLKRGLEKIRKLIESRLENTTGPIALRPIDCYDILMHASDFVISGGLRRSATICLFSKDDNEMMNAKTGDWFLKNPQRGRSNNSVVLKRSDVTKTEFKEIFESIKQCGEPGFFFCDDDYATTTNPSLRAGTQILTENGIFGIEDLENKEFRVKNLYGDWESAICKLSGKNKKLYKVNLMNGFSYFATKEHKWPVLSGKGYNKKETVELKTNDKIPFNRSATLNYGTVGSYSDGFVVGWLYGDGWITHRKDNGKTQYGFIVSSGDIASGIDSIIMKKFKELGCDNIKFQERKSEDSAQPWLELNTTNQLIDDFFKGFGVDKKEHGLPSKIWNECSEDFRKGLVDGLMSSDGSIDYERNGSTKITLTCKHEKLLTDVRELLGFYGIHGRIRMSASESSFPNGKNYLKEYTRGDYVINRADDVYHFNKIFNITASEKHNRLLETKSLFDVPAKTSYIRVKSVEETELHEDVWDLRVDDDTHCFTLSGCITGNCVEIGFWPMLPNGESGVNFCNLCEINGKWCDDEEKFLEACRASAIIGTLQAGYNDFPYLGKTTEEIVRHEALLGCSITGWMDNPEVLFNEKTLQKGAKEIKKKNEEIAAILGINPAARLTCSKPAGSTSCVLKTASGIHPHHAKRYIRRVQGNKQEFPVQKFKEINPLAVEESVWSANNTDEVISFLCEVPAGSIVKNQITATKLLESVKTAQKNWVLAGNVPERALNETVTHNVSNTITVQDDEWDEVCDYIYKNRQYFTGVSLLAASGDLDYPQAPFSTVLSPTELFREYGDASVFASGLIVDGLSAFNNNLWKACDTVLGFGEKLEDIRELPAFPKKETNKSIAAFYMKKEEYDEWFDKVDWIRRAKQFAERYFDGNVRKMTHCLKHVSLWKTWCDLTREYEEIDWENVVELDQVYTDADTLASQACVGTKGCDI